MHPPPFPPDRFPHAPPPLPFMDASNVDGLLLLTQVYTSTKGLKATTDKTLAVCANSGFLVRTDIVASISFLLTVSDGEPAKTGNILCKLPSSLL